MSAVHLFLVIITFTFDSWSRIADLLALQAMSGDRAAADAAGAPEVRETIFVAIFAILAQLKLYRLYTALIMGKLHFHIDSWSRIADLLSNSICVEAIC